VDNINVIASGINDNELAHAFSALVAERWDNWDLSPFMVYLVDICAPTVLPYLADQFDIDGLRGFGMAVSEDQQRDIIKKSIALHKFLGTPWAIREACRTVGFPVIVLEEGVTAVQGGPTSPDDWARFRVLVEADTTRHITEDEARKLRQFVEYYKNERSHLVELGFYQSLVEGPIYRPDKPDRDDLDIITMSISPNPLALNASGQSKPVQISVSADWMLESDTVDWGDGSGALLHFTFTGKAGDSVIIVTSDANHTGDREITIPIKAMDGRVLGTFKIMQLLVWNNAYSHAYSNAYNTYDAEPYVEVPTKTIFFPQTPEKEEQIDVLSNTDWIIT
jgi:P2-related tail formation protein